MDKCTQIDPRNRPRTSSRAKIGNMNTEDKKAAVFARYTAAVEFYKGIRSKQVKELFALLSRGGKYSTLDLSTRLGFADPRAVVRNLKNELNERGAKFKVCTQWTSNGKSARYKVYWLE